MCEAKNWLSRLDDNIDQHITHASLNNETLARTIAVSERHLFRSVKAATGLSPQKYLRQYRLKKAKQYLVNGKFRKVKEAAHAVGYSNTSYFISEFEKEFGKKPLSVLQAAGWR